MPRTETAAPTDIGQFELIHVDDSMLVADKPAGLLAVPGRGPQNADCLSARLQQRFPEALIVHRLDMSTSGLMVFARSAAAQRTLGHAFERRLVHKRYIARVAGRVPPPPGADGWADIELPIGADWPNRPRQQIDATHGKAAHTRYRVLPCARSRSGEESTLLLLEPVTGRTHQLRVHLQAIGHPILGDALYGTAGSGTRTAPRLMLHATRLELPHPSSEDRVVFESAVPFD